MLHPPRAEVLHHLWWSPHSNAIFAAKIPTPVIMSMRISCPSGVLTSRSRLQSHRPYAKGRAPKNIITKQLPTYAPKKNPPPTISQSRHVIDTRAAIEIPGTYANTPNVAPMYRPNMERNLMIFNACSLGQHLRQLLSDTANTHSGGHRRNLIREWWTEAENFLLFDSMPDR